jgi:hypothetical protein
MEKRKTSSVIALALAGLLGLIILGLFLPPLPRTKARPMKSTARNSLRDFSVTLTNGIAIANYPLMVQPISATQP